METINNNIKNDDKTFNSTLNLIKKKNYIGTIDKMLKIAMSIGREDAYGYIISVLLEIFQDMSMVDNFIKYITIDPIPPIAVEKNNENIYSQIYNLRLIYKFFFQSLEQNKNPLELKSMNLSYDNKGQAIFSLYRLDGFKGSFIMDQNVFLIMLSSLIQHSEQNYLINDFVKYNPDSLQTFSDAAKKFISKIDSSASKQVAITDDKK